MNKRDIFLPSATTLTIFAMMVFLSCAHQNRVQDDLEATNEEESVVKEAENTVNEQTTEMNETVTSASNDLDMNLDGEEKKLEEAKTDLAAPMENAGSDLTAVASETKTDDLANDPLAEFDGSATAQTVESNLEPQAPVYEPVPEPVVEQPVAPKKSARTHHVAKSGFMKVPKIPSKPLVRSGTSLNRFYFLRKGDTPSSVSSLIYGSANHSKDLQKWNPNLGWTAGHIVFYASPSHPKDSQIGSFYRENGVEAEEYTVHRGDWISKIATQKLGSSESWKEIAVINGMSRPDKIEVGQKIAIYPKDLSSHAVAANPPPVIEAEESVASTAPVQEQPMANPTESHAEVAQIPPPAIPPEVQNPAPEAQQAQAAPIEPAAEKAAAKPAVDSNKVVEQNLPAAVILGGVLILSAAYLAVRRRRLAKTQNEEFDEIPSSRSNRK